MQLRGFKSHLRHYILSSTELIDTGKSVVQNKALVLQGTVGRVHKIDLVFSAANYEIIMICFQQCEPRQLYVLVLSHARSNLKQGEQES